MIDIHCHLIPNIDDGSKNVTETFEMAKRASELGYKGIFATPHYIKDAHETSSNDVKNSVEVLNKLFKEKNIDCKVYVGNELYFTPDMIDLLKTSKVCTLGNSKYVLIEFPLNGTALNMQSVITNICQVGYVPIIAHPERYTYVQKNPKMLEELIRTRRIISIKLCKHYR